MNKTNKILVVVLAIQFALFGVRAIVTGSSDNNSSPGEALVSDLAPDQVTEIQVSDSTGKQITIQKVDDEWELPDYGAYPVDGARVTSLLSKIEQVRTDRLITQSETSFRRLEVSPDTFAREVVWQQADGKSHTLYLGKTGSGNTIHVRLDDQKQVYLVNNLSTQDANAQPSGWIDTTYFTAASDQITSLRLENANGVFEFAKTGDTWTFAGLDEGETLNDANLTSLLNALSSLRFTAPIGKEAQDDFGLDAPQATITIHVMEPVETEPTPTPPSFTLLPGAEGTPTGEPAATPEMQETEYTFVIGAEVEDGVVLKGTNSDYYVAVSKSTADRFTSKTRADFVTLPPTPTPEPTTDPASMEETAAPTEEPSDAQPTATPTPEPTEAE
jgi:hypothetical protein